MYLPTDQPTLNLHRRTPPRSDARDLWHLGHWLQFWQLGTWIHDDRCYLTIKSDTGQHSQFLQCLEKWNHFCFIVNISSVTVLAYINVHFHETLPLKSIWSIFGSSLWLPWDSILSNFKGRHLGGGWYGPAVLDYYLEKHLHHVGLLLKLVSPCLALLKQSLQQIVLDFGAAWSAPLRILKNQIFIVGCLVRIC